MSRKEIYRFAWYVICAFLAVGVVFFEAGPMTSILILALLIGQYALGRAAILTIQAEEERADEEIRRLRKIARGIGR